MDKNLKFDFEIDKANNRIHVTGEFSANLEAVWKAWTTAELVDQWWGPKPCRAETKFLDFRVGGYWLYGMIVPMAVTGSEKEQMHWGKQGYDKIVPYESFSGTDVFCDENGIKNPKLPEARFENLFYKISDEKTRVTLISTHRSFEDMEAVIAMGYKEGIAVCFNQLDDLLK
jgi:uncharacterized protein YndB with AHSA1/START domain